MHGFAGNFSALAALCGSVWPSKLAIVFGEADPPLRWPGMLKA